MSPPSSLPAREERLHLPPGGALGLHASSEGHQVSGASEQRRRGPTWLCCPRGLRQVDATSRWRPCRCSLGWVGRASTGLLGYGLLDTLSWDLALSVGERLPEKGVLSKAPLGAKQQTDSAEYIRRQVKASASVGRQLLVEEAMHVNRGTTLLGGAGAGAATGTCTCGCVRSL